MPFEPSLPWAIALYVAAAVVVFFAGGRLARDADEIAGRTRFGHAFLGVVLLGSVTSLPELTVGVTASIQGTPELSVNDVLGSAAVNVVVLAVADLFVRGRPLSSSVSSPQLLLQGVLGMAMMALAVGASVAGDVLLLGVGAWCWLMVAVYLGAVKVLSSSNADRAWQVADAPGEAGGGASEKQKRSRGRLALSVALSALVILVAGVVLTATADAIAKQTGLGTRFFGVVFVAVATSLPEVSTVLAAVRMRRYDLAAGDVLGTNLFNVLILALVDALHSGGPVLLEVGRTAGFGALLALVLTAVLLVGMLERPKRTVLGLGLDSITILALYAAGVVVLANLR